MHVYAFGSLCRGDIRRDSDIDLLAIVSTHDDRFDPNKFSIYSYSRIEELWHDGSPFAWHLAIESRLVYASDDIDFLKTLGEPSRYASYQSDYDKFFQAYQDACTSLRADGRSKVFDLSTIFLSIRNISTCFSLAFLRTPVFSRHSVRKLPIEFQLEVSDSTYQILERSRVLCTRGVGSGVSDDEVSSVLSECNSMDNWMSKLNAWAVGHGRI